jgi:pimeloyl-ACP methyl ester carboxylesterase
VIREARLIVGGRSTRYLEAGAGWPVILLHAFPLNADMWRPQLEQVPDGWRLIAPDLRGFGPAAEIRAGTPAPTMDDFADDVDELMDALEIPEATIGGLSMGGYVTFALCRRAPERFTGMILADTKAEADTPDGRAGRQKMIEIARAHGAPAVAEEMLPRILGSTTHASRPQVVATLRQMIESASVEAITDALEAVLGRADSTSDLAAISWPALVMVGAEDGVTPLAHAEAMQVGINRSRLVLLPAAGHVSNLETPDAFSRAVADFLQSNM